MLVTYMLLAAFAAFIMICTLLPYVIVGAYGRSV